MRDEHNVFVLLYKTSQLPPHFLASRHSTLSSVCWIVPLIMTATEIEIRELDHLLLAASLAANMIVRSAQLGPYLHLDLWF